MNEPIGSLLRSLLNDLKRRPIDAARELDISVDEMHEYLDNEKHFPIELIAKACQVWPISPRDFAHVIDDTDNGVKIMRAPDSEKSARVMERKGKPYYEYRDTAASSLSSFRPEWIKELCEVEDNDPQNTAAQWNNGHFMHQFTYFVGPVNFYYIDDHGQKQVAVMNTGDSMYIRPFVPHTFTTRKKEGGEGLILALTYGGALLGDAQQELGAVSTSLAEKYALAYSNSQNSVAGMIQYYMNCLSLSVEELAQRAEMNVSDLSALLDGKTTHDHSVLKLIAKSLNVNLRDILTYDEHVPSVIVDYINQAKPWLLDTREGSYSIKELASTPHMAMSKSLEFTFSQDHCLDYGISVGLHQYVYNVGNEDIKIHWTLDGQSHESTLKPNDSAFIKPFLAHCYNSINGKLISLRIPSKISGDALRELSMIGTEHIQRVANEKMPWFDKNGKN